MKLLLTMTIACACACAPPSEQRPPVEPPPSRSSSVLEGKATYYSDALAGHSTASGERYDPKALTAAHPSLPFGTRLRVTRTDNGRTVVVRVNDRGPFGDGDKILDLSRSAAEELDMLRAGVVQVRVEVLGDDER